MHIIHTTIKITSGLAALTTQMTSVKVSSLPGGKHVSLVWSLSLQVDIPKYSDGKPVILVWSPFSWIDNPQSSDR